MTRSAWLARLVHVMEEFAPTALADRSWDNVGLLLECPRVWAVEAGVVPEMPHRVLLTIDITEAVFEEAVRREAQLILAYHPPWFRGEKSLTLDRSAGMMRMVALCASQGISIYSPHSALDAIQNGSTCSACVRLLDTAPSQRPCAARPARRKRRQQAADRAVCCAVWYAPLQWLLRGRRGLRDRKGRAPA